MVITRLGGMPILRRKLWSSLGLRRLLTCRLHPHVAVLGFHFHSNRFWAASLQDRI